MWCEFSPNDRQKIGTKNNASRCERQQNRHFDGVRVCWRAIQQTIWSPSIKHTCHLAQQLGFWILFHAKTIGIEEVLVRWVFITVPCLCELFFFFSIGNSSLSMKNELGNMVYLHNGICHRLQKSQRRSKFMLYWKENHTTKIFLSRKHKYSVHVRIRSKLGVLPKISGWLALVSVIKIPST